MLEDIKLSFKGIWLHKLRSFLTMLGIIVGVAAVIAVVSTINGTNEQIKQNLIGGGTNTVHVKLYDNGFVANFDYGDVPDGIPVFKDDVISELLQINGAVTASAYNQREYCDNLFYKNNMISASVNGIDENYFQTVGLKIVSGRGFSTAELQGQKKLAVIDSKVADAYFDGEIPIGKTVDIKGEPFVIIGIVEEANQFEPTIKTIEDYYIYSGETSGNIYIPQNIWPLIFRYDEPVNVVIKASSTDAMTKVGKEAAEILNQYLTLPESSTMKYQSTDLASEASDLQQLSASTSILLIGIASISLLVGGIGVMNIMLVSVTERTREIGLKKALGARKSRIRRQFLTEAVILSGLGGVIGVIVGIILSKIISIAAMIPIALSIPAMIIAVAFSMVIGIVFGMLPSIKASNLNPIEALRYE